MVSWTFASIAILELIATARSALTVSQATGADLGARLVAGSGLTLISSSLSSGDARQGGVYSTGPRDLADGILLSTGDVASASNPTSSEANLFLTGGSNEQGRLCKLVSSASPYYFDGAVLTLNLAIDQTQFKGLRLSYVMATEDPLTSMIPTTKNEDVFGVFIDGVNVALNDQKGGISSRDALFTSGETSTVYDRTTPQREVTVLFTPGATTLKLQVTVCDGYGEMFPGLHYDSALFLASLRGIAADPSTTTGVALTPSSSASVSTEASVPTMVISTSASTVSLRTETVLSSTAVTTQPITSTTSQVSQLPLTPSSSILSVASTLVLPVPSSAGPILTSSAAPTMTLAATLPAATSTTTYSLSVSGMPLICSGTAISRAPTITQPASPITIDSNGILVCGGKQAFLRRQAPPSQFLDIILSAPQGPAGDRLLPGYFSLASGSLFVRLTPFVRLQRRQVGSLPVGPNAAGVLVAGQGVTPVTGTPVNAPVISASGSVTTIPAPSGPLTSSITIAVSGSGALPSSSSSSNTSPVTVTSTVTLTVPGTQQTVIAVQVFINGLPVLSSGSGANGLVPQSGQTTVIVTVGSVFVAVSVGGLRLGNSSIISGLPALGGLAAVIVNVVVIIAPVVIQVNGVAVTSLRTMQGFVTVTAGGSGGTAGGSVVTLVNPAPIATIVAKQTLVVPSVNAAGVTIVPIVPVAGVAGIVVPPAVIPVIVKAAAGSTASSGGSAATLPASRSTAQKAFPAVFGASAAAVIALVMLAI